MTPPPPPPPEQEPPPPPIYWLSADRRSAVRFVADYPVAVVGAVVEAAAGTPPAERRWIVGDENLPAGVVRVGDDRSVRP